MCVYVCVRYVDHFECRSTRAIHEPRPNSTPSHALFSMQYTRCRTHFLWDWVACAGSASPATRASEFLDSAERVRENRAHKTSALVHWVICLNISCTSPLWHCAHDAPSELSAPDDAEKTKTFYHTRSCQSNGRRKNKTEPAKSLCLLIINWFNRKVLSEYLVDLRAVRQSARAY